MQTAQPPLPTWYDRDGSPLHHGQIYIGTANTSPSANQVQAYWDAAGTIPAAQPLRTLGGYIVNGTNPSQVYFNDGNFAIEVQDGFGVPIVYSPNKPAAASYQPLDADLTAISGQSNTAYGLALLTVPNQAGLRALLAYPASLPLTGGTMTGNINRQSAGAYTYWADPAMTSGRIFVGNVGDNDPTNQNGDQWLQVAP